ncbi:MAG: alpha/beta hydrolase, partial [Rhodospirillales bacterium]|nr:alpha/beta hydrolase [Rhodospirillales bacterium]
MPISQKFLSCLDTGGFHRIAYTQWGKADNNNVVICAHGLSRNGRDFDMLAAVLEDHFRVACPDIAGRGISDWLQNPKDYDFPLYLADMTALIARMDVDNIHWIGTSMGGLIGMLLAAQPNTPIKSLVINDVGPLLPKSALQRIGEFIGTDPRFPSLKDAESFLRQVNAPFGPLTDNQWAHLAKYSFRQDDSGDWCLRYDPGIAVPFRDQSKEDVDLWPYWERVTCPALILRGAESDLLSRQTAKTMQDRGTKVQLIEYPGIGHAPA